ncbi:MAG: hypothetical protein WC438_04820 [Candidatus Pacearchaeota archaeon]
MQDKKGMVFTLIVLTLLSLFVLSYSFYSIVKDREPINKRVNTMNNFVFAVEQDIPRQLYISGFRSIFLFEKQIIETGQYITNVNYSFHECFFNGTINGIEENLMIGARFSDIQDSLNLKANKINAEVNLSNPSVQITQDDPWNVKFVLTADLLVKDDSNSIMWNKTFTTISYVSIENFEDPLYLVNTNGLVKNNINKTIYNNFSDVTDLLEHVENSYYIAHSDAPSFLDRLQGINQANANGIESLVYLPGLSSKGVSVKDKSCVDYIYFSNNNPSASTVVGMPSWFKLDDGHVGIYTN